MYSTRTPTKTVLHKRKLSLIVSVFIVFIFAFAVRYKCLLMIPNVYPATSPYKMKILILDGAFARRLISLEIFQPTNSNPARPSWLRKPFAIFATWAMMELLANQINFVLQL